MKILCVYSSTEGHTAKVMEFIASRLRFAGDEVTLLEAAADVCPMQAIEIQA